MARQKICRKICFLPNNRVFSPSHGGADSVILLLDEFEALRLCDLEHMDQDSASKNMNVSRGTYQRILYSAREKIADAIVNGKNIKIGGGNCEVFSEHCLCSKSCKTCPHVSESTACKTHGGSSK